MITHKELDEFINKICKLGPYLNAKGILNWLDDEKYLKLAYRAFMGKKLNLKNPKTYNEKLQWLKLYNRNPEYTNLVDKYEARKHIEKMIGKDYLIPLLGIYESFDEIDFESLPNNFVLKCTHDSGGVIVCNDKSNFNIEGARKKLNESLKRNYYYLWREWPYKNIKPRIICEKKIETKNGKLPADYKFHCFNGVADNVMVCTERDSGNPKFFFFDREWNLLRYNIAGKNADKNFKLEKPELMDEMFEIANKLSKGFPFLRVDIYCENGKIYFGELTFFPDSGFDSNLLEETDILFGKKIILEGVN